MTEPMQPDRRPGDQHPSDRELGDVMSLAEAAVFLRVRPVALLVAARRGQVPSRTGCGGGLVFSRAKLQECMSTPAAGGSGGVNDA